MNTAAMPWCLPSYRTVAATSLSLALHGLLSSVGGRAPQFSAMPLPAFAVEVIEPEEVAEILPEEAPEPEPKEPDPPAPKLKEPTLPAPADPEPEEPEVSEPRAEPVTEPPDREEVAAIDSNDDASPLVSDASASDLPASTVGLSVGARPGSGRRAGRSGRPRQSSAKASSAASAPVPLANLSERPVPPALDALLKQNYPRGARLQGRPGTARVALLIGKDGRVSAVRSVSASEPEFGAACKKTLLGSRWSPPRDAEGRPVPTIIPYECRFEVTR